MRLCSAFPRTLTGFVAFPINIRSFVLQICFELDTEQRLIVNCTALDISVPRAGATLKRHTFTFCVLTVPIVRRHCGRIWRGAGVATAMQVWSYVDTLRAAFIQLEFLRFALHSYTLPSAALVSGCLRHLSVTSQAPRSRQRVGCICGAPHCLHLNSLGVPSNHAESSLMQHHSDQALCRMSYICVSTSRCDYLAASPDALLNLFLREKYKCASLTQSPAPCSSAVQSSERSHRLHQQPVSDRRQDSEERMRCAADTRPFDPHWLLQMDCISNL